MDSDCSNKIEIERDKFNLYISQAAFSKFSFKPYLKICKLKDWYHFNGSIGLGNKRIWFYGNIRRKENYIK